MLQLNLNRLGTALFTIFAVSLVLTSGLIIGCGDEGDPVTEMVNGDSDKTTEPEPVDPVVDPPPEPVDPPPAPGVSFNDDINPIIVERCALGGCHDNAASGGLNLTSYDNFKQGGNSGAAFVAGDENSLVVRRIDGGGMPPGGPPLNADQIQLFVDWINEGAENN